MTSNSLRHTTIDRKVCCEEDFCDCKRLRSVTSALESAPAEGGFPSKTGYGPSLLPRSERGSLGGSQPPGPTDHTKRKRPRKGSIHRVARGDRSLERDLKRAVRRSLFQASNDQDDLHLWFVTLQFNDSELSLPDGARDPDLKPMWAFSCAELFAEAIKNEGYTSGALLVLDISDRGRPHLHGLVLSKRRQVEVDLLWRKLSQHYLDVEQLKRRVQPVSGSDRSWNTVLDRRPHPVVANINGTINYACKALPPGMMVPLQDRLIRTGIFEQPEPDPSWRLCPVCNVHRLTGRQQTCSAACRKAKQRASSGDEQGTAANA